MIQKLKKLTPVILTILTFNLISAYSPWNWGYGYGFSPAQLLQNEWFVFGAIFILTFALVYLSLNQTLKRGQEENKGPIIVISLVVSFIVAAATSQRAILYGYIGETIGSWVFFIASILVIALLVRISYKYLGTFGLIVTFVILWIILRSIDPYNILPYNIAYDVQNFYYFISSGTALVLAIIIGIGYTLIRAASENNQKTLTENLLRGIISGRH